MVSYEYVKIDEQFLQSLEETVLRGNSVVVIGHRYVGKQATLDELEQRLRLNLKVVPLCRVRLSDRTAGTETELCRTLVKALPDKMRVPAVSHSNTIDGLFRHIHEQMILIVGNIDSISQPVAQHFLRALESTVEEGKIIAVLSGEADVREMLGGVRNEFRIAQRYVLQGYGEQEFCRRVKERASRNGVRLDSEQECLELLFAETGGSFYVALLLLRNVSARVGKRRNSGGGHSAVVIKASELKREIDSISHGISWRDRVALNAVFQIWQDPYCCADLEKLLRHDMFTIYAPEAHAGPTTLELAGVAVRGGCSGDPAAVPFKFSSPLMKAFALSYFDDITLGDLYVNTRQWEQAVERYKRAPEEDRIRPRKTWDRSRADNVIRMVCAKLHIRATGDAPVGKVDDLFVESCRYVLGFREVSSLAWKVDKNKGVWHIKVKDERLTDSDYRLMIQGLPPGDELPVGRAFELQQYPSFTTGIAMRSIHPAEREAVILSDFGGRVAISPARQQLLDELIEHYVKAREHALKVEMNQRRMYVLQQYRDINRYIGAKLEEEHLDVNAVLDFVADRILQMGYRVVSAGLYAPRESRVICGVYKFIQDGAVRISYHWPSENLAKEQLLVARSGESREVPDEEGNKLCILPLGPRNEMQEAQISGSHPHQEVTHTLTVQRTDFAALSQEERDDLTEFGDQLLEAIRGSERIILLQSSLSQMNDPVAIVDANLKLRYANSAVNKVFNIGPMPTGRWQSTQQSPLVDQILRGEKAPRTFEMLAQVLQPNSSLQALTELVDESEGQDATYYGRINIGNVRNSRKRVIGAYLLVQDFSDSKFLFEATQLFFSASADVLVAILLNIDRGKDAWRRFYRVDANNPDLLISAQALGPYNEDLVAFNQGRLIVDRSKTDSSAWLCFERQAPVLLKYTDVEGKRSKYGVPIDAVPNPPWTGLLARKPGDMWLDVPLFGRNSLPTGGSVGKRWIGKLCMHCDDEIRPEMIQRWGVLGAAAGLALENLERESEGRQNAALAAERVFLASMAHNLHTRIASLSTVEYRYELYAYQDPSPKLQEINRHFSQILSSLQEVLERVKRQLGELRVVPTLFDLCSKLRAVIEAQGLKDSCDLRCAPETDTYELFADRNLIEGMFYELLQNSHDAVPADRRLRLGIVLQSFQSAGRNWIRIIYTDNGPGVPLDMKAKIFNLFFSHRTNGTTGTGLGLYFAKRVAMAHGGSIVEDGEYGAGARFVIELPTTPMGGRS
jgi:signal transduction histidine kinase/PAS domain-containing protein